MVAVLRNWLQTATANTIGDIGNYGRRVWLHAEINGYEMVLNADTKRAAVEKFVLDSRANPEQPWRVVANRNGLINRVIPGPYPEPIPGWYGYLVEPLDRESLI